MDKLTNEQLAINTSLSTDHTYPSYNNISLPQAKVSELPISKPIQQFNISANKPLANMPGNNIFKRNP